jgi:hypothetical protein
VAGQASAYSADGVVLEHAYGGALLAQLLGGPISGPGSDVTPDAEVVRCSQRQLMSIR